MNDNVQQTLTTTYYYYPGTDMDSAILALIDPNAADPVLLSADTQGSRVALADRNVNDRAALRILGNKPVICLRNPDGNHEAIIYLQQDGGILNIRDEHGIIATVP